GTGHGRVEQRVEDREPEYRIVPEVFVVFGPHKDAAPSEPRVGEREPDAEAERIGEEQNEERRGRQHEPRAEPLLVGLEAIPRGYGVWRLASPAVVESDGHCVTGAKEKAGGRRSCLPPAPALSVDAAQLPLGDGDGALGVFTAGAEISEHVEHDEIRDRGGCLLADRAKATRGE